MRYEAGKATVDMLCHVDNRTAKASHGELLNTIYIRMMSIASDIDVFVRERAFSRFARETQALNKVVGIADLVAWQKDQAVFCEIAPTTVKKLLTGSGRSEKEAVAGALERYLGFQIYKTDDESDAAAVGVAWLLQEKLLGENRCRNTGEGEQK
ncbi:MAG: crossover junction endodeoxyribonuclease RuvC [Clostridia bacterium]|nr:crossover junction endodeoxyribonuclease RuvC [Clostridia bacterium]